MKRFFFFFLSFFLLFVLSGCDGGFQADASFTYILSRNISTLDPQTASGPASGTVIDSIFEGICRIDSNGKATPGAAKRWEAKDDSRTFTFHLRNNLCWSNGTPLTAQDFVFGITRALSPATGAQGVDDLFILKNARAVYAGELEPEALGVSAEDDRTLVIELEQSYPDFPAFTAGPHYMPCNREYFEACSGHYGLSAEYLITNGPFTFSSIYSWNMEYGQRKVSLVRSNTYQGEHRVFAAELTYLIDYNSDIDSNPVSALQEGSVDILPLSETMAKAAEDSGCRVIALNDAVTGLLLNSQSEVFQDAQVRQLFLQTLDRKDLLERHVSAVEGGGEAFGIMPDCIHWNGSSYYQEGESMYLPQDDSVLSGLPELLKRLDLERLPSITVICPNDEDSINVANGFLVAWNQKLQNSFNILPLSDSEFQSRIASGDYEAALYTLRAGGTAPFDVLKSFESSASPSLMNDTIYDSALHSLSFDLNSYQGLESMLRDAYIFYPLFRDNTYYAMNPNVRGIAVAPDLSINFTQARKRS